MQAYAQPLTARSTNHIAKAPRRTNVLRRNTGLAGLTDESTGLLEPVHADGKDYPLIHSPFQAALLLTAEKQAGPSGLAAYVCYLNGRQVVSIDRLHGLRGHNPQINLTSVISDARGNPAITGVILATWQHATAEQPYDQAFIDEVERQYDLLRDAGIQLIDHLRISETGVYSYFGQHEGPYRDSPIYHEKSIGRLY